MQLTVGESQPVTVDVFNSLGQHDRTLLDRKIPSNRRVDLTLDGSRLGSGLYIIRVEGSSFEATRKTVLVK